MIGDIIMEKSKNENNLLECISALSQESAIRMLIDLCEDQEVAERISKMVKLSLPDVDVEEIADDVFDALNSIEVEELWDNSGETRYGYNEPTEVAFEMLEDALRDFTEKMAQYKNLDMKKEEKKYCKGLISGLVKYASKGSNEFADWVPDDPYIIIENILYDWKQNNTKEDIEEIQVFHDSFFVD
jgi:hypothetical protein